MKCTRLPSFVSKTHPCDGSADAAVRAAWGRLAGPAGPATSPLCFRGRAAVLPTLIIGEKNVSLSFVPGRNGERHVSSESWSLSQEGWSRPRDNTRPVQLVLGDLCFPSGMSPREGPVKGGYDTKWPYRRQMPVSRHAPCCALPGLCLAPQTPLTCVRGACGEWTQPRPLGEELEPRRVRSHPAALQPAWASSLGFRLWTQNLRRIRDIRPHEWLANATVPG